MHSEWSDEVVFPIANAVGYRLIFEAEAWLRRICWTALLLSEGPAWAASIDDRLRRSLDRQSKSNSSALVPRFRRRRNYARSAR
jgi:hypothetical protein